MIRVTYSAGMRELNLSLEECLLLLSPDNSKTATAKLTVVAPTTIAVTIDPSEFTLNPGDAWIFHATVTGTSDTRVTWSVAESGGGRVDGNGVYIAPSALLS